MYVFTLKCNIFQAIYGALGRRGATNVEKPSDTLEENDGTQSNKSWQLVPKFQLTTENGPCSNEIDSNRNDARPQDQRKNDILLEAINSSLQKSQTVPVRERRLSVC